jgi:ferrous iron transport protein B
MKARVALIGNPNVGKSVIFNNLVPGARQHIGNWPGKTVEKKAGTFSYKGNKYELVDLPGCYSLTSRAMDELVSRTYILEEKPEVVVNIVDASNIERNLYLTLLLMELEANVVLVLNQMDVAKSKGYTICSDTISSKLNLPVVETVATMKIGMKELKEAIQEAVESPRKSSMKYSQELEDTISKLVAILNEDSDLVAKHPPRWLSIKILEKDQEVTEMLASSKVVQKVSEVLA